MYIFDEFLRRRIAKGEKSNQKLLLHWNKHNIWFNPSTFTQYNQPQATTATNKQSNQCVLCKQSSESKHIQAFCTTVFRDSFIELNPFID